MKKYILSVVCSLLLLTPLQAWSAETIEAESSAAGLGTRVLVRGLAAQESLSLLVLPPKGATTTVPIRSDATGSASADISGKDTQIAGTYTVFIAKNGNRLPVEGSFDVLPDALDDGASTIDAPRTIQTNGAQETRITVTLKDRYGNPLPHRTVELISSRPQDRIAAEDRETDESGRQHFTLSTQEPGQIILRAVDLLSGEALRSSAQILVDNGWGYGMNMGTFATPFFDPMAAAYQASLIQGRRFYYAQAAGFETVAGFEIEAPAEQTAGQAVQSIVIRAVDRQGKTVEDYVGTITFSSTDPDAEYPLHGESAFRGGELGEKTLSLAITFQTPGEQVLRVEDKTDASIFGEATIKVNGVAAGTTRQGIEITSHKNDQTVSTTEIVLEGSGPAFVNLVVMGGQQDVQGATDENGHFVIPISLNPAQRDFTLRVQDESGRYDSGSLHLVLDVDPPTLGSISFSPEQPVEETNVLLVVNSEAGLSRVLLRMGTQETPELSLAENPTAPGSYQLLFTAPAGGSYQPSIVAQDSAGNSVEVRTTLTVSAGSLATVRNVRAESIANAISLEWDQLEEDVDGYRVYVGEKPDDFLYTLDTERPTSSATISGLTPGRTYYFAVTALKDERESEKSATVSGRAKGMLLTAKPGEANILLEWSGLPDDVVTGSFILEYGVEEGAYTEKRSLHGALRAYTLHDLLTGVLYHLRLTPVTVTGEVLADLAAVSSGTPGAEASGFHPAPSEPLPFVPGSLPPPSRPAAPGTPSTGIPPIAWWLAAGITALGGAQYIRRRRTIRHTVEFLRTVQAQYQA